MRAHSLEPQVGRQNKSWIEGISVGLLVFFSFFFFFLRHFETEKSGMKRKAAYVNKKDSF